MRRLLRAVAVLGDGARLGDAAELAEIDLAEARALADLLADMALLAPGDGLSFAHPIVREAEYADYGGHERAAHTRVAEILAARGAPAERIAAQLLAAEPVGDAEQASRLHRVGADALAQGAPDAAAAWLTRALAEPPPPGQLAEVLLDLGIAEHRLGRRKAVVHLKAAVEASREPRQHARAVRWLACAETNARNAEGAVTAIEEAIERLYLQDREQALLLHAELFYHARNANADGATRRPSRDGSPPRSASPPRTWATAAPARSRNRSSAADRRCSCSRRTSSSCWPAPPGSSAVATSPRFGPKEVRDAQQPQDRPQRRRDETAALVADDGRRGQVVAPPACDERASAPCEHVPHPFGFLAVGEGDDIGVSATKDVHRRPVPTAGAAAHVLDDPKPGSRRASGRMRRFVTRRLNRAVRRASSGVS